MVNLCPLLFIQSPAILASTADAPSPALTGFSRDTLGHRGNWQIHRMNVTARMRRSAHAEQDSLEPSAA
jgi:hypothetical protein